MKSTTDEKIIKAWDINEYTDKDYEKVRGSAYLYRAYERGGCFFYTYGAYTPSGTKEIESFRTEKEAKDAGYAIDRFFNLYLNEYN